MILMLNIYFLIFLLSNILMLLAFILSKKIINDREKLSPFECGFDPNSFARIPFSMSFFLIAIIFLIFDVEISLILPMIMLFKLSNLYSWTTLSSFFIIILLLGIYYEWTQNMFNWSK